LAQNKLIGKTISHYRILEKIGEGGMGVVYKAEDTKLKRNVALKFLPPEWTRDPDAKERLLREARAAASLDHPNICTVYEIDEAEGQTFISMTYIEGKTLKNLLEFGPLDIQVAQRIIVQIAQGLHAAHQKGVVHRDVKAANIILTEKRQAKITDFGLAKLEMGADITQTIAIMGTVAYMSPEQARGDYVDLRTDIWSLGVLFYEMLTGQLPFSRDTYPAELQAIMTEDPTPLASHRSDVPEMFKMVISKSLEKNLDRRYKSLEEFIQDLTDPYAAIAPPTPKKNSIVVLPFENISPDRENEYFSDGLTEEIIADLSQIKQLHVISRTSAMRLKGTDLDLKTIGRKLAVEYVLEGSVRKQGDDLRITAQLIDAEKDVHLWADKYDGTIDDVFDIQEKVSRSIVDALKVKLSPKEEEKIAERPIADANAYECYLQARQEIWRFTEESLERALQLIQNGLKIVGHNALLYAAMGTAFWLYVNAGIKPGKEFIQKAEKCISKTFELDPDSPHGYFLKGAIHVHRGNMREAVEDLRLALSFDANNADALLQLARVYASSGQISAAERQVKKLLEIDPLNTITYSLPGYLEILGGNFEKAPESYRKMTLMDPHNPVSLWFFAWSLTFAGRNEEAFDLIDQLAKYAPKTVYASLGLFTKFALKGNKDKALKAVTPLLETAAKGVEYLSRDMAHGYALIDEKEKALDWLENAINRGFIAYPFLSKHDFFLENIRGEERFHNLMERIKYEWETFDV
jgi:serine/threonine protein kinase/lipopolysaccharide biosynthesis regulator YciM